MCARVHMSRALSLAQSFPESFPQSFPRRRSVFGRGGVHFGGSGAAFWRLGGWILEPQDAPKPSVPSVPSASSAAICHVTRILPRCHQDAVQVWGGCSVASRLFAKSDAQGAMPCC